MEEDIKILKGIIELYRSSNELPYKFNGNIIQAIENLINRVKKLEEENRTQRRQLNSVFDRGFIHKDKVKKF